MANIHTREELTELQALPLRDKVTHPKQYDYIMKPVKEGGLGYKEVIDWINENNGKGTIIRY